MAFADQASSSGYFRPVYMLHEAGLAQGTDYEAIFAGGHEGSFAALDAGPGGCRVHRGHATPSSAPRCSRSRTASGVTVGESPAMDIQGAVLGRPSLDAETHKVIQDGIAEVFSPENAERSRRLRVRSRRPRRRSTPDGADFESFAEIAAVAGVELKDLK